MPDTAVTARLVAAVKGLAEGSRKPAKEMLGTYLASERHIVARSDDELEAIAIGNIDGLADLATAANDFRDLADCLLRIRDRIAAKLPPESRQRSRPPGGG